MAHVYHRPLLSKCACGRRRHFQDHCLDPSRLPSYVICSPSEASELRTVCTCCTASKSSASFCFILIQHFAVAPMSQVSDSFNANSVWLFSYRTSVPLIPVAYFYWEQMRNPLSSQWHTVCRETAAFISFLPLRKPIHTQPKRISIIQYMWFSETQRGHVLL